MEKINIYIMDIKSTFNTSGVDRYINTLIEGLSAQAFIQIIRIQLTITSSIMPYKEVFHKNYIEIVIPMPQDINEVLREKYWIKKYNQQVYSLISHLFNKNSKIILHLQTLNLIDLALYIKKQVHCKIITHLHCIPWKGYYNTNRKKFNFIYYKLEVLKEKDNDINQFMTLHNELSSYTSSDQIICVTNYAKTFLQEILHVSTNLSVVPNGIMDSSKDSFSREKKKSQDLFKILFVGHTLESKGILFALEALRKVQSKGFRIEFFIAGSCTRQMHQFIKQEYRELSVIILGRIPYNELITYYKKSDIVIISSIYEQCSYVAIEMAMFGLPIITTAVDGLNEIFEDGINALKVNIDFSKIFGIKIDTEMFCKKIVKLIENELLRETIARNARKLYEERYSLNKMLLETINIYKKTIYE